LASRLDAIAAPNTVVRSREHAADIINTAENLARRLAHMRQGRQDLGGLTVHSKALDDAHAMMRMHTVQRDLS
jgi:hypothetical protein